MTVADSARIFLEFEASLGPGFKKNPEEAIRVYNDMKNKYGGKENAIHMYIDWMKSEGRPEAEIQNMLNKVKVLAMTAEGTLTPLRDMSMAFKALGLNADLVGRLRDNLAGIQSPLKEFKDPAYMIKTFFRPEVISELNSVQGRLYALMGVVRGLGEAGQAMSGNELIGAMNKVTGDADRAKAAIQWLRHELENIASTKMVPQQAGESAHEFYRRMAEWVSQTASSVGVSRDQIKMMLDEMLESAELMRSGIGFGGMHGIRPDYMGFAAQPGAQIDVGALQSAGNITKEIVTDNQRILGIRESLLENLKNAEEAEANIDKKKASQLDILRAQVALEKARFALLQQYLSTQVPKTGPVTPLSPEAITAAQAIPQFKDKESDFAKAHNAIGKAQAMQKDLGTVTDATRAKLEQAQLSMAMYGGQADRVATAITGVTKQHFSFAQQMSVALRKLVAYRAIFYTLRTTIRAFKDQIGSLMEFEYELAQIRKVVSDGYVNEAKLLDAASRYAIQYGGSIKEILGSMKTWAQQGKSQNEIIELTNTTMLASASANLTVTQSIEALTAATKVYNIIAAESPVIVAKWMAVQAEHAITAQDLANSMKILASTAKVVGLSIDEFLGYVTAVATVTRKSGKAVANSLKTVFARVSNEDAISQLNRMQVAVYDIRGELRPLDDILTDLSKTWNTMSRANKVATARAIGGVRRYADFVVLMDNWNEKLIATRDSLKAWSEADRAASIEANTFKKTVDSAKAAMQAFGVSLSGSFAGIKSVTEGWLLLVTGFQKTEGAISGTSKGAHELLGFLQSMAIGAIALKILSSGLVMIGKRLTVGFREQAMAAADVILKQKEEEQGIPRLLMLKQLEHDARGKNVQAMFAEGGALEHLDAKYKKAIVTQGKWASMKALLKSFWNPYILGASAALIMIGAVIRKWKQKKESIQTMHKLMGQMVNQTIELAKVEYKVAEATEDAIKAYERANKNLKSTTEGTEDYWVAAYEQAEAVKLLIGIVPELTKHLDQKTQSLNLASEALWGYAEAARAAAEAERDRAIAKAREKKDVLQEEIDKIDGIAKGYMEWLDTQKKARAAEPIKLIDTEEGMRSLQILEDFVKEHSAEIQSEINRGFTPLQAIGRVGGLALFDEAQEGLGGVNRALQTMTLLLDDDINKTKDLTDTNTYKVYKNNMKDIQKELIGVGVELEEMGDTELKQEDILGRLVKNWTGMTKEVKTSAQVLKEYFVQGIFANFDKAFNLIADGQHKVRMENIKLMGQIEEIDKLYSERGTFELQYKQEEKAVKKYLAPLYELEEGMKANIKIANDMARAHKGIGKDFQVASEMAEQYRKVATEAHQKVADAEAEAEVKRRIALRARPQEMPQETRERLTSLIGELNQAKADLAAIPMGLASNVYEEAEAKVGMLRQKVFDIIQLFLTGGDPELIRIAAEYSRDTIGALEDGVDVGEAMLNTWQDINQQHGQAVKWVKEMRVQADKLVDTTSPMAAPWIVLVDMSEQIVKDLEHMSELYENHIEMAKSTLEIFGMADSEMLKVEKALLGRLHTQKSMVDDLKYAQGEHVKLTGGMVNQYERVLGTLHTISETQYAIEKSLLDQKIAFEEINRALEKAENQAGYYEDIIEDVGDMHTEMARSVYATVGALDHEIGIQMRLKTLEESRLNMMKQSQRVAMIELGLIDEMGNEWEEAVIGAQEIEDNIEAINHRIAMLKFHKLIDPLLEDFNRARELAEGLADALTGGFAEVNAMHLDNLFEAKDVMKDIAEKEKEIADARKKLDPMADDYRESVEEIRNLQEEMEELQQQHDSLVSVWETIKQQAYDIGRALYDVSLQSATEEFNKSLTEILTRKHRLSLDESLKQVLDEKEIDMRKMFITSTDNMVSKIKAVLSTKYINQAFAPTKKLIDDFRNVWLDQGVTFNTTMERILSTYIGYMQVALSTMGSPFSLSGGFGGGDIAGTMYAGKKATGTIQTDIDTDALIRSIEGVRLNAMMASRGGATKVVIEDVEQAGDFGDKMKLGAKNTGKYLAMTLGPMLGGLLGGGGAGATFGAQTGIGISEMFATAFNMTGWGAIGLNLGAALFGGLLGGFADNEDALDENTLSAVDNTIAVRDLTATMEDLRASIIRAPAKFVLPVAATAGGAVTYGGIRATVSPSATTGGSQQNTFNVAITVNGTAQPTEIQQAVKQGIDEAIGEMYHRQRLLSSRG
jgi:TP901 family phage tail tape measure protein